MNEYLLLSDIRDQVRLCFADNCQYQMVITRGRPSPECNLIAFWTGDEEDNEFGDCEGSACDVSYELQASVQLVRVCAAPQGQLNMDWAAEEDEARCFYADLERLKCCLRDLNGVRELQRLYGVRSIAVTAARKDPTSQGGAYRAIISIVIKGIECCDPMMS